MRKEADAAATKPLCCGQCENNKAHIQWLLNAVKTLQRECEADKRELNRVRERVERSDSE